MIIAKNPYIMLAAHHEPMYWSCHKGIAVTIGMGHFFHDSMYIQMLLSQLAQYSLVHWYQQCASKHHVPKCMICHKAIVTERTHCFHDWLYITPILLSSFCEICALLLTYISILLLCDSSTQRVVLITYYIHIYMYMYICTCICVYADGLLKLQQSAQLEEQYENDGVRNNYDLKFSKSKDPVHCIFYAIF